jgi:hypothetical protein
VLKMVCISSKTASEISAGTRVICSA